MIEKSTLYLNASSVLNIPFQTYNDDFTFIVNGKEFKTKRIISDLLSPKICQLHTNDPTQDQFIINTVHEGDFSIFFNLINFKKIELEENEFQFISEIIEILKNDSIELNYKSNAESLTIDNVFERIKFHEKYYQTYFKLLQNEIDFISSHFYILCTKKKEHLHELSTDTLEMILNNPKIELIDEEQLLEFINELYEKDPSNSYFYEFVDFSNVRAYKVEEFIEMFNINDITNEIWKTLSVRLKTPIYKANEDDRLMKSERYRKGITISFEEPNYFKGIINYLQENSDIDKEIKVDCSGMHNHSYGPYNAICYDQNKYFCSDGDSNSWISFDFKDHFIIPTGYSIKSGPYPPCTHHPKTWVIEGSNDNKNWNIINEQNCCSYLNGKNIAHSFPIKNPNCRRYKLFRMRQTGSNWSNCNFLAIDSFEIFGTLL